MCIGKGSGQHFDKAPIPRLEWMLSFREKEKVPNPFDFMAGQPTPPNIPPSEIKDY